MLASIIGIVAGLVLLLSVILGACTYYLLADNRSHSTRTSQRVVVVPVEACPSLRAVHDAAQDAAQGWLTRLVGSDESVWHEFAGQVAPRLARLELALRVAVPQVPDPVQSELRVVLREVEIGRAELPFARNANEYQWNTGDALLKGTVALNDASDLVGTKCAFKLSPVVLPRL